MLRSVSSVRLLALVLELGVCAVFVCWLLLFLGKAVGIGGEAVKEMWIRGKKEKRKGGKKEIEAKMKKRKQNKGGADVRFFVSVKRFKKKLRVRRSC